MNRRRQPRRNSAQYRENRETNRRTRAIGYWRIEWTRRGGIREEETVQLYRENVAKINEKVLQYEVATADRVISIPRRRTSVPGSQQQLYSRRFYLYEAFTSAVILAVNRAGPIKRDRASVLSLPTFDVRLDRTISLEINGKPHYASRS